MPAVSYKKRFIAGAKCPECGALDCVQTWQPVTLPGETCAEGKLMVCVDCGYQRALADEPIEQAVKQSNEIFRSKS